jgi:HAE1 family hydrophobic/amphiphilic exporter-1
MSLPDFSTRYPVTITMATLAVVLLGWISLDELGTDLLPNLQTPVITVDLQAPGKSPQEMEERYTRLLERGISTVSKVRHVYSITRAGQSVVVAEFSWEAQMDFALLDVQKRVASLGSDEDVEVLDVTQEDPQALPVMRIAVSAPPGMDLDALLGTVELAIKTRMEAFDGVASAEIEGGAEKEVRVILDPFRLQAYGQNAANVTQRITLANQDVSGGTIQESKQSYQLKGLGRLRTIDDVRNLIIAERQGGTAQTATTAAGTETAQVTRVPLYVKDVGRVELRYEDRETIARLNGVECIGLAVYKEGDANTVTVVNTVMDGLAKLQQDLPDLAFTVVENQAHFIEQAVAEVEESAFYGALLAVFVLLLFLRSWTATLIIGLAIPISVLATFTLMYFEDLTLNIMTLGGLALGAGMLVDNAIVVIENIYRHLEAGSDSRQAAAKGASEVGVAIMASTLTTVSVFLPIIYLHGLTGELFKEQAWTVAFSLVSSLVVAMTVVPMLASRFFRANTAYSSKTDRPRFRAVLQAALNHKGRVLFLVLMFLGLALHLSRSIQSEFIPRQDQGLFHVDLALPEGTRLEVTDRTAHRVGQIIQQVGADEVDHVYLRSGVDPALIANAGDPTGPNRATLSVALHSQRSRSMGQLVADVDAQLKQIPDLEVKYQLHETALEGFMGSQAAPVQVEISGDDLDTLQRLTAALKDRLEALSTVYNLRTNFQGGQPEVDLGLRQEVAAAFGLTTQDLIQTLERRLSGEVAGELSKDQRARTIRVGYEDVDLRQLKQIRIDGPDGAVLTLKDIAEPRLVTGPREILRQDQRRIGRITGYIVEGAALSQAIAQVQTVLDDAAIPPGYRVDLGGAERERAESFAGLEFALILAVVLVYMVMASLFESLLHPFTVMFTVPLAGVGVVLAFWLCGEPLSVMAYIGIIMLGGIAVNDAIVLVDRINQLRQQLSTVRQAVLQATQDRLRPILMTSVTTVLALAPMIIGFGEGGRLRAPMAIAVIGGLVSSTLLTLIVIPTLYEAFEGLRRHKPNHQPKAVTG